MPYVLRGTVFNDNAPEGGWTVRLLKHSDGSFVAEEVTSSSGEFEFSGIDNIAYDLYAFDDLQPSLGDGDSPYARNLHIGVEPALESSATDHRYWRVRGFVDSGSNDGVQFAEIRPHLNGFDITASSARTGTAPTSTTPPSGTIALATDNDLETEIYWNASTTETAYIQFDFGAGNETTINQFQLGVLRNLPTYWPSQFDLEFSDDGAEWEPFATVTTPEFPWPSMTTAVFSI